MSLEKYNIFGFKFLVKSCTIRCSGSLKIIDTNIVNDVPRIDHSCVKRLIYKCFTCHSSKRIKSHLLNEAAFVSKQFIIIPSFYKHSL